MAFCRCRKDENISALDSPLLALAPELLRASFVRRGKASALARHAVDLRAGRNGCPRKRRGHRMAPRGTDRPLTSAFSKKVKTRVRGCAALHELPFLPYPREPARYCRDGRGRLSKRLEPRRRCCSSELIIASFGVSHAKSYIPLCRYNWLFDHCLFNRVCFCWDRP